MCNKYFVNAISSSYLLSLLKVFFPFEVAVICMSPVTCVTIIEWLLPLCMLCTAQGWRHHVKETPKCCSQWYLGLQGPRKSYKIFSHLPTLHHPSLTCYTLLSSLFDQWSQKVPSLQINLPYRICLYPSELKDPFQQPVLSWK